VCAPGKADGVSPQNRIYRSSDVIGRGSSAVSRQKKKALHRAAALEASKDECVFCPRDAGSMEHMIPAWLLKENQKIIATRTAVKDSAFVGMRKDGSEYVLAFGQNPEIIAFIVCDECNTGWMKRCEDSVVKFLKPMMRGDRRDLSTSEQFFFSMWLLKTAMVMDSSKDSETKFFTKEQRYAMRRNYGAGLSTSLPFPNNVHAWVGAYSGSTSIAVEGHTFNWLHEGMKKTQINAYAFTIIFGQVFGQILVTRVPFEEAGMRALRSPKVNLAQRLLYQIFRPRELPMSWPPHEKIDDVRVTLDDTVLRWGGKGKLSVIQ
jgi:hypothetical protein